MRISQSLRRQIESPTFLGFCVALIMHALALIWLAGVFKSEQVAQQGNAPITMSLASFNTNAPQKAYSKPAKSTPKPTKAHKKKHKTKHKIPTQEILEETPEQERSQELAKNQPQTPTQETQNEQESPSNQTSEGSTQELLAHNEGIDDEFYRKVEAAIAKKHDYPQLARIRGMQGRVEVEFILDVDGSIEDIHIVRSNTGNLLNKQAIQTIKDAHKLFPVPSKRVRLKIPINYGLEQS